MYRRKDGANRYVGSNGQQIIDKATYNKLTSDFTRRGGIIIRGEEARRNLEGTGSYAAYLPGFNSAVISDEPTVSDVLEEMYHAMQDRTHMFGEVLTDEVYLRREIDAQKYLLSVTKKYKIPDEEVQVTKNNLQWYEDKLKTLLENGG